MQSILLFIKIIFKANLQFSKCGKTATNNLTDKMNEYKYGKIHINIYENLQLSK